MNWNRAYSPPCTTARRGARAINKMARSIPDSEAGVVFRMKTKGKPPRLRQLRLLRDVFLMTQPPLLAVMQGGECARLHRPGFFVQPPLFLNGSDNFDLIPP